MEKQAEMSPKEAANYLGVSRRTLERYVQDGRLIKQEEFAPRRVYFFVSDLDALKEGHPLVRYTLRLPVMIEHFDDYLEKQGLKPVSEFIGEPAMVAAPKNIAELMHLAEGTPVVYRFLRQGIHIDNRLVYYRLSENYYNPDLVTSTMLADMQKSPRYNTMQALEEHGSKVVVRAHTETIARLPNDREQSLLGVSRGVPMLDVTGTNYAEDNTVVFVNHRSFIGDLASVSFEFPVTFWKQKQTNSTH